MSILAQTNKNVIILGNFDGVHLGHQKLIQKALEISQNHSLKTLAITFDPSPKEFFGRQILPKITTTEEKIELLKNQNLDQVEVLRFDQKMSGLSGEEFIWQYLVQKFQVHTLIVGADFGVGKNRDTDVTKLQKLAQKFDFEVVTVEKFNWQETTISSGLIREFIKNGEFQKANQLLGRD